MLEAADKRNRAIDRLFALVQAVCLLLGIVLLGLYGANRIQAEVSGARALDAFEQTSGSAVEVPDQSLWSESRKAAFLESLGDNVAAVGMLSIPRLDLRVPIFDGTSERNLNIGVGRIEGTAALDQPGNLGIAGHRDGFFRVLKDVARGDTILVRSSGGDVRYRVVEILIVDPEDVYVLNPTETASVTLVTCYPFYVLGHAPQRFIVHGELDAAATGSPAD